MREEKRKISQSSTLYEKNCGFYFLKIEYHRKTALSRTVIIVK